MNIKHKLSFYNNILLEERLKQIKHKLKTYEPNFDENIDLYIYLFNHFEYLYVAFNTEQNKFNVELYVHALLANVAKSKTNVHVEP